MHPSHDVKFEPADRKIITEIFEEESSGWYVFRRTEQGELKISARTQIEEAGADNDDFYQLSFSVPPDFGEPGALLVESTNIEEFYLQTLTLEQPDGSNSAFACNSWVNKTDEAETPNEALEEYKKLFGRSSLNKLWCLAAGIVWQACLPKDTPAGLKSLRALEMELMRGDGTGERKFSDRIYDYDVYNDLGDPLASPPIIRPTLGGPGNFLYPRRCRTGRPVDKGLIPGMKARFDETPDDFDTLLEVFDLYKEAGVELFPKNPKLQPNNPVEWMTDEEFGREAIAGINPVVIRRATTFPPTSNLPEDIYGPGTDLTPEDIDPYLITKGRKITAQEAIRQKRLFTIDYHDVYLPYAYKIIHENLDDKRFIYAARAFFFLTDDQQLKPVAIELSLPSPQKGEPKPIHRVFTPPKQKNKYDFGWQLAKMHFASIDFGFHELVSHWLKCHAVVEPIIIASHRQLSAMHPIFVLLEPTFVNTMRINANALNFTPGQYANELAAVAYDKLWRFDKAGLPSDLLERGMAEPDPSKPEGVKLLFDDYPFAKDALDVWNATKKYVTEYVKVYYETDQAVASDEELQAWWKEIREEGHADKAKEEWWPSCTSIHSLIDILCTIFYMTGPQHAGVNFGQYGYAGFMPNRPSMTRLPIPEPDTPEYKEMLFNFERYLLRTASSPAQTISIQTIVSSLSVHAEDEEYLGQRRDSHWTSDPRALEVFSKFSGEVERLERMFKQRNENPESKNRFGAYKKVGYTLMYPTSGPGLTGKGIPWSISI
ncbi:hypothetical protein R1sor_012671 [Riccia sorocarpa]|uniref:Lipoxygenase n=1 Tax=Riccia sorocarpa TaxID=122646 RepID=A0ABD3I4F9_9MARC